MYNKNSAWELKQVMGCDKQNQKKEVSHSQFKGLMHFQDFLSINLQNQTAHIFKREV